jgi:putative acetyltransferase
MPPDILIRAVRVEDADAICRVRSLPGVRHGTLSLPFPSVEASRKWIEALPKTDVYVVAESAGAVVGCASLHRKANRLGHCASVGIMVHDDHQGRGVGTALMAALVDAADKWLGVLRLELEVNVDNVAGLALYRRFGFVVEGRSVACTFRDGEYVDCFTMARLAGVLAGRHRVEE